MISRRSGKRSSTLATIIGGSLLILISGICFSLSLPLEDDPEDSMPHHRVKRWKDFPNVTFTFDCTGRSIGFYADVEFDCMLFHLCDPQGRRIPFMCGKSTSFNQKFRVCDWSYNVDCEKAPDWYYLNDLTYEKEPEQEEEEEYYYYDDEEEGERDF